VAVGLAIGTYEMPWDLEREVRKILRIIGDRLQLRGYRLLLYRHSLGYSAQYLRATSTMVI